MTRQWLAIPDKMCLNHVLGEHAETHGFIDKMEKGYSLDGFYKESMFFGAEYLEYRHTLLLPRIPGHGSPIKLTHELKKKYPLVVPTEDDVRKSLFDLFSRCGECYVGHFG